MARPKDEVSDESLISHIARLPHRRATFKQLVREMNARGPARETLEAALDRLTGSGTLVQMRSGQYALAEGSREFVVGKLRVHRDGFAFVIPETPAPNIAGDLYLPREQAQRAMHGDRVVARIVRVEAGGRADGEIVRVLKRAHQTVVGEFRVKRHGNFVRPHEERIQQWIEVPEGMEIPPSGKSVHRVGVPQREFTSPEDLDGMIVNVEILDYSEDAENMTGRVIEVLGSPDDFGIDVEIIIRKHHIPHQFPDDVLEQAKAFSTSIPDSEIAKRRDFRDLDIVTIDGETARDFDDAVWVDRLPNGNYALQVHIADVSHYVTPGSPIDREAAMRGTSVYFPDRAVPMLPVELSTDVCSLRPQVDRLVMSALLEIDNHGAVVQQEFVRGVIRSAERMTYTNVHLLLEGDAAVRERYAPLIERFELMQELALKLNRKRMKRGSIDFDMPEAQIEFDQRGDMVGVVRSARNFAHRLIEEFMLMANDAVAGHLEHLEIPSLYRIHEPPDPKRIMDFEEIASKFGYSLGISAGPIKRFRMVDKRRDGRKSQKSLVLPDEKLSIPSRNYQKLAAKLAGKPEERILTYLMLRSLKQAKYSEENVGHYALASPTYTHFTSPIRRYPDLIVHRVLGAWMDAKDTGLTPEKLHVIGQQSSDTERRADEAERELMEWKKAKFMQDRVGEQFEGLIISTAKFGFFVELDQYFVEGLVPIDTLPGDRFRFHENVRKVIGERSRVEYSIGDRLQVILDRVDPVENKLTFSVVPPERGRKRRRE